MLIYTGLSFLCEAAFGVSCPIRVLTTNVGPLGEAHLEMSSECASMSGESRGRPVTFRISLAIRTVSDAREQAAPVVTK